MTSRISKTSAKYTAAVGIDYNPNKDSAPIVCVKGSGYQADEIVRLANRYGIPIIEKGEIASILSDVPVDEEIPEDIYEAVALILSELKSVKDYKSDGGISNNTVNIQETLRSSLILGQVAEK